MLASGGMVSTRLAADSAAGSRPSQLIANLPALPISLRHGRPALRRQPPLAGEHGIEVLRGAGLLDAEVSTLVADGKLAVPKSVAEAAE